MTERFCVRCGSGLRAGSDVESLCGDCRLAAAGSVAETAVAFAPEASSGSGVVEGPPTWEPGDVLLDTYEVGGVLGEGGFGTVYRVRHRGWGLDLAVKSPQPARRSRWW